MEEGGGGLGVVGAADVGRGVELEVRLVSLPNANEREEKYVQLETQGAEEEEVTH